MSNVYHETAGLSSSLWLAGAATVLMFIVWAYPIIYLISLRRFLMVVLVSISTGIGLFLISFPLLNLILQVGALTYKFISSEIMSGGAILRLTAVMIGFFTLEKAINSLVPILSSRENSEAEFVLNLNQISQFCIFCVSAIVLISVKLKYPESVQSVVMMGLNWLLFFFIDDWVIISQYAKELNTRPINLSIPHILIPGTAGHI